MSNKPILPLNFKPKYIRQYEEKNGSIFDNLDTKVGNLIEIIKAGNGMCDDETAENILETFLSNGGDVVEALLQIVEKLQGDGFLPRDIALGKAIRTQVEAQLKNVAKDLEKME